MTMNRQHAYERMPHEATRPGCPARRLLDTVPVLADSG